MKEAKTIVKTDDSLGNGSCLKSKLALRQVNRALIILNNVRDALNSLAKDYTLLELHSLEQDSTWRVLVTKLAGLIPR